MTRIHRGQLFVRGGWRDGGATLHAVAGIAEVDPGTAEHVIHGYTAQRLADGVVLSATGFTAVADIEGMVAGEVDHMVTNGKWPRPADGSLAGGGLMLRRTRAPAAPGRETMIVAGLFSSRDPVLRDQTRVDLEGDLAGSVMVTGERCVREWNTNGSQMSQVLRTPHWGWDAEPWAFNSTMDLQSIDEAMEVERLLADPDHDPAELERARRRPGGWAPAGGRSGIGEDRNYDRFKQMMVAERGPLAWDGVMTLSEKAARDAAAERIVREIMDLAA